MDTRYLRRTRFGLAENPIGQTVYWAIKGQELSGVVVGTERNDTLGALYLTLDDGRKVSSGIAKIEATE